MSRSPITTRTGEDGLRKLEGWDTTLRVCGVAVYHPSPSRCSGSGWGTQRPGARLGPAQSNWCWCERGDLNPHGFPRWILSPVRLPIPPLSRVLHEWTAFRCRSTPVADGRRRFTETVSGARPALSRLQGNTRPTGDGPRRSGAIYSLATSRPRTRILKERNCRRYSADYRFFGWCGGIGEAFNVGP